MIGHVDIRDVGRLRVIDRAHITFIQGDRYLNETRRLDLGWPPGEGGRKGRGGNSRMRMCGRPMISGSGKCG